MLTLYFFAHFVQLPTGLVRSLFQTSPVALVALQAKAINCSLTMNVDPQDELDEKWQDFDFTNAIGLLLLMKEIQEQEPLNDPDILKVDEDGTPLY